MFSIPTKNRALSCRGFTLFEILVAIFIFSVLITVLFGSFRFLSSSIDSLGTGADEIEMGRRCISRVASDISEIRVSLSPEYKHPETRDTEDDYRIIGDSESIHGTAFSNIRFTAPCHISFDGDQIPAVSEIVYYVHKLRGGELVLRRSDQLFPFETFEEKSSDPIVCKDVLEFTLTYFDEDGEESEKWDSESSEYDYATPRSVKILLKIGSEDAPNVFTTRVRLPVYREALS